MKGILSLYVACLFFVSCGSGGNSSGCAMGAPQQMFSEKMTNITNHGFRVTQNNSTEEFLYKGDPIVIYQTGCDQIEQEYQMTFKEKTGTDKEGMEKVAKILFEWSRLDKNLESFAQWAQQINLVSIEMKMGESFTPTPGIEIFVDRVNIAEGEILSISFKQKA